MNSESRLARIFIASFIVSFASLSLAFAFSAIAGEMPFPKKTLLKVGTALDKDTNLIRENLTEKMTGVEKIEIEAPEVDVTFVPSTTDDIRVEFEGTVSKSEKDRIMSLTHDGTLLRVKTRDHLKGNIHFNFNFDEDSVEKSFGAMSYMRLKVLVPAHFAKAIEIVKSSDVNVRDLTLGNFEAHVGSGDIKIEHSKIDHVEIKTGSGDLDFRGLKGEIVANTGSGDVVVKGYDGNLLSIHTGSGDVSLYEFNTDNVKVDTGSGDVTAHLKISGGWNFALHTGSGDVTNHWTDDPSGKRKMAIRTGSGDIKIVE